MSGAHYGVRSPRDQERFEAALGIGASLLASVVLAALYLFLSYLARG